MATWDADILDDVSQEGRPGAPTGSWMLSLSTVTTLMLSMMKEEGEEEGQGKKVLISTSKNSEDASLSGQGWHGAKTHQDCFTLESISFDQ